MICHRVQSAFSMFSLICSNLNSLMWPANVNNKGNIIFFLFKTKKTKREKERTRETRQRSSVNYHKWTDIINTQCAKQTNTCNEIENRSRKEHRPTKDRERNDIELMLPCVCVCLCKFSLSAFIHSQIYIYLFE